MEWVYTLEQKKRPKLDSPVLIEGLPGIGNVGKIAVDFMIEKLGAKKLYTIFSHHIPHSVFVNEENIVELPKIEIYYKKSKNKKDLLFLAGDTQPIDEPSSYSFAESLLKKVREYHCQEIITLGGIGLKEMPKEPKVYITGTSKEIVKRYKTPKIEDQLYGEVGPIVGLSGILVGLAKRSHMDGIAVLGQTIANPLVIGVKTAREILEFLNDRFNTKLNLKYLDGEIKEMEKELQAVEELDNMSGHEHTKKVKKGKVSYIG